ncbi:MAG: valine--tRNA ligase [Actinomycetota bacterium]
MELSKTYEPHSVEGRLYELWERSGFFEPRGSAEPFCMVLPPPNVTGSLHMGHALEHSLQDAIIRRKRMQGFRTLWLPGTDHAGIATQNVVERELAAGGKTRHDLGREKFLERVWEWKAQSGSTITKQMRRLGDSCAWSYERFTMDEGLSKAVREIFVRWYDEGLIYRGNRITNWCPRDHTALSDIEVEHKDVDGELIYIRYPFADGSGSITIATTRVETMLGDTAVAVNPNDDRYTGMIGKNVLLPIMDREIPIIADEAADPEFGAGALKVTPAHDPTDFEIGARHSLPAINVLDKEGRINSEGGAFEGMDRFEARVAVLEELKRLGLVENEVRPFTHAVGHCYRCKTQVEQWLSEQWFVKVKPLAEPAIKAVREGKTRFVPERYARNYFDWMENLRDWCISRQLWWGHRIPVWYCENDHQFASREDPTTCPKCSSGKIEQDPDVLDTWFSSALWPFSTLGWPDDTEDLRTFYPTSVLSTGYDIITFWVSRMMMDGIYATGVPPFKDVFIHGMVRDFKSKKMSKSFGNVIDPLEFIDKYGADALRMTLIRSAVLGGDAPISEQWVEGDRNFANKLWNLARFVLTYSEGFEERPLPPRERMTVADRWILSRLERARKDSDDAMERYDFSAASRALREFAWTEFADWYVEWSKGRLQGEDPQSKEDVLSILIHVLSEALLLLHPLMPFVTEELHTALRGTETIMLGPWPAPDSSALDLEAEARMSVLQSLVSDLRRFRADHHIQPSVRPVAYVIANDETGVLVRSELDRVRTLSRWGEIMIEGGPVSVDGPTALISNPSATIVIPLEGVLNVDDEISRLRKEIAGLEDEAKKLEGKLGNEEFVAKAPAEVVDAQRDRLGEARQAIDDLHAALQQLERP